MCSKTMYANGICVDGIADYTCQCYQGWEDKNCSTDINNCLPHPCNTGSCVDGNETFSCDCSQVAFSSEFCQIKKLGSVEQNMTMSVSTAEMQTTETQNGVRKAVADAMNTDENNVEIKNIQAASTRRELLQSSTSFTIVITVKPLQKEKITKCTQY